MSVSTRAHLPRVYVMMATYNGEKYVTEQIESILHQEGVEITLRICDDGSSDGTMGIVERLCARNPNIDVTRNKVNLGVGKNFMQMVYEVRVEDHDYFAFSDQDDVWLPNKMAVAVREVERKARDSDARTVPGYGTPVLYCSDITNVDADLSNPRRELQSIRPSLANRGNPLVRNWYAGCTMVFNPGMVRLARQYEADQFFRIHDAWMFLIAFYCANVTVDLRSALILRRISGSNQVGESFSDTDVRHASIRHLGKKPSRNPSNSARQLLEGFRDFLSEEDLSIVERVATYASSPIKRIEMALSPDFRQPSRMSDLLLRIKFLLGRL